MVQRLSTQPPHLAMRFLLLTYSLITDYYYSQVFVVEESDLRDLNGLMERLRCAPLLLRFNTRPGSLRSDVRQLYVDAARLPDVAVAHRRSQHALDRRAV